MKKLTLNFFIQVTTSPKLPFNDIKVFKQQMLKLGVYLYLILFSATVLLIDEIHRRLWFLTILKAALLTWELSKAT